MDGNEVKPNKENDTPLEYKIHSLIHKETNNTERATQSNYI